MRDLSVFVPKHINWIDLLLNASEIRRTSLFIQILGITVRWISIDGLDETVHRELFQSNRGRPMFDEALG